MGLGVGGLWSVCSYQERCQPPCQEAPESLSPSPKSPSQADAFSGTKGGAPILCSLWDLGGLPSGHQTPAPTLAGRSVGREARCCVPGLCRAGVLWPWGCHRGLAEGDRVLCGSSFLLPADRGSHRGNRPGLVC